MPFIRVKSKTTGHEFDVHPDRLELHKGDWSVVDKEPVDDVRPPKYAPAKAGVVTPPLPVSEPIVSEPDAPEVVLPLKPSN